MLTRLWSEENYTVNTNSVACIYLYCKYCFIMVFHNEEYLLVASNFQFKNTQEIRVIGVAHLNNSMSS